MLIGLTGGIGAGKSTVAAQFTALNITTIKADEIGHALIKPSSPYYNAILKKLGKDILIDNQHIDRPKLRQIMFTNPEIKVWLEELLHPQVYKIMQEQIKTISSPYCVLELPLLIEKPPPFKIDRILVVDCPVELQIIRILHRDPQYIDVIQQIINSQVERTKRLSLADDIIINDGFMANLKGQVLMLHKKYLGI